MLVVGAVVAAAMAGALAMVLPPRSLNAPATAAAKPSPAWPTVFHDEDGLSGVVEPRLRTIEGDHVERRIGRRFVAGQPLRFETR